MPDLRTLLAELNIMTHGVCPADLVIEQVSEDSRRCGPGVLYVAIPGTKLDGHDFLADAAARGGTAALISRPETGDPGFPCILIENPRLALARIAQRLAGDPSHGMKVLGVTGTNGKTTVVYLLESIFRAAGMTPGVMGTISVRWGEHLEIADQTTPSPTMIADRLARMKSDGVEAVAMEVSSHALDQHRVDGIRFAAAGLTNLTQDHLDYHPDMEAYFKAKRRLFTEVLPLGGDGVAVLNLDDPAGRACRKLLGLRPMLNYGLGNPDIDLKVERIRFYQPRGISMALCHGGRRFEVRSPMVGLFNTMNCLTAAAMAFAAGIDTRAIQDGIAAMPGAPGRFEFVQDEPFAVVVDYAHTPDSVLQLMLNARGLARKRLIAVFGCGGDRDKAKRPLMGRAVARLADVAIVTNDNPRTEDPKAIADQIVAGINEEENCGLKLEIQLDRREAIRRAVKLARPGDAVVIAGKGHEDYQIVGTEKHHFDDREVAQEALGRYDVQ